MGVAGFPVITPADVGDVDIDGLFFGTIWDMASLPSRTFTYSNSDNVADSFQNPYHTQQKAVEDQLMAELARICNFSVQRLTESSSVHAVVRSYDYLTGSSTGAVRNVGGGLSGDADGDSNMLRTYYYSGGFATPIDVIAGSRAWLEMRHERLHGLGMKHPESTVGGTRPVVSSGLDATIYTLISNKCEPGASNGWLNSTWGHPQSFMVRDFVGLISRYGINPTPEADRTLKWLTDGSLLIDGVNYRTPGDAFILEAWFKPNDGDKWDLTQFSDRTIDTRPGAKNTFASSMLPIINTNVSTIAPFNVQISPVGGRLKELKMGGGTNYTHPNGATQKFESTSGNDVAIFHSTFANYSPAKNAAGDFTLTGSGGGAVDGATRLQNYAAAQFTDSTHPMSDFDTGGSIPEGTIEFTCA